MKKTLFKIFIFAFFISFFGFSSQLAKPVFAAGCTYSGPNPANDGNAFSITYNGFAAGEQIGVWDRLSGALDQNLGTTQYSLTTPQTYSGSFALNPGGYSVMIQTRFPIANFKCADVDITSTSGSPGGGGGGNPIGVITPPAGIPQVTGSPTVFIAGLLRAVITLLIIVAFIVDLFWVIFAGFRFVTAGGDPKSVSSAWGQIYWGILGMIIVMGSYAIVKLVEIFFGVCVISCFQLPSI